MWGGLYLPIFLMRDGLFALINVDSLIILAMPCPSLPLAEDFQGGGVASGGLVANLFTGIVKACLPSNRISVWMDFLRIYKDQNRMRNLH